MPFAALHTLLPEVAERETRIITILPDSASSLPPGDYALCELFCNDPGCDCRRVMFYVLCDQATKEEAVVSYGWETRSFYAKWLGDNDPGITKEMQGPVLSLTNRQSKYAPAILDLIKTVALTDPAYIERIKCHYAMFRAMVTKRHTSPALLSLPRQPVSGNGYCPCGSQKKYKKCCGKPKV